MAFFIKKGATDVTRYVFLQDATTGAAETGYTITDLDLQYTRNQSTPAAKVDATALAAANTAHTDNYAFEIDATDQPGVYRIDWPDAAFATGVSQVVLTVKGTGIQPAHEVIQLVDINVEDTVRMGLTALPNAAADAAGGLPISDAGGLDLDSKLANTNEVTAARMGALTDWINGGRLDLILDDVLLDTAEIGAAGAGLTNINLPNQTMDIVGNITGNLSGSVGSVTGAVGSVTGAVGSVTGAVGSVTGLTASDVAAIKAKTDSLTFTVAGQVDANVQAVNDVALTGTGTTGDEWGPA